MQRLVVIMDNPVNIKAATIDDRFLEWNSVKGANSIISAVKSINGSALYYNSVDAFLGNIEQHKSDLIFPLLYGINSPTSKSIIPAICEGYGIQYIGADTYAHALCNDKKMSSLYAKDFGIKSSNSVLLRFLNIEEKGILNKLQLPLIVKPNYGGGSTGIAITNVTHTHHAAYELAEHLHRVHKMPILVEEIIEGYEVEFIIVGNQKRILFTSEVKLLMDQQDYFIDKIWSYETKKINDSNVDFIASNHLSTETKQHMIDLFQSFSKIEFMRIDGRLCKDSFYLIELSPDCYLGDDCAVASAFNARGYSYEDMIKIIVNNALYPDLCEIPNNLRNLPCMGI